MIETFEDDYYFLALDSHANIEIDGLNFKSATAAFFSVFEDDRKDYQELLPSEAREKFKSETDYETDLGATHELYKVLYAKFSQNMVLRQKLIETEGLEFSSPDTMLNRVMELVRQAILREDAIKELMEEEKPVKLWDFS